MLFLMEKKSLLDRSFFILTIELSPFKIKNKNYYFFKTEVYLELIEFFSKNQLKMSNQESRKNVVINI